MPESLERRILLDTADSRLNEYYYRHRTDMAALWDRLLRIITAAFSGSGALASVIGKDHPALWQFLVAVGALAAILSAILNLPEDAKRWSALAVKWSELSGQLDLLEAGQLPEDERRTHFLQLHETATKLHKEDHKRRQEKLARRLQQQVVHELSPRFATTA